MNATLLKKIFTRYAVLAFMLTVAVPPLCVICAWSWHAFVPIGLRGPGAIEPSLMALVSILAGWFWAAKAPLPDSLFIQGWDATQWNPSFRRLPGLRFAASQPAGSDLRNSKVILFWVVK